MSNNVDQQYAFKQLEYCLQALALEPDDQLKQFEDFAVATDELMLDFDNWSNVALGNYPDKFNEEQLDALVEINDFINTYFAPETISIADELATDPWWKTLRLMARSALLKFDWEMKSPPASRNV